MTFLTDHFAQQYFQRIGYSGKAAADLPTLRALHELHPASIPFENIDVLLNNGIDLSLEQINTKIVKQQRGGYCFEQNNLLMAVLRHIGFSVDPLMARVLWQLAPDAPANPRNHMVLRVMLEGEAWLVDVGFGGLVLTAPLKMVANVAQTTQHEPFRLIEHSSGYVLEAELDEKWHPVYQLGLEPQLPIDIEVANWYTSTHPHSKFRHVLMAARTTESTRYTLLNNRLTIRQRNKAPVRRELTAEELADALTSHFLLPVENSWAPMLADLAQNREPY